MTDEDMAKESLSFNALTAEVYTWDDTIRWKRCNSVEYDCVNLMETRHVFIYMQIDCQNGWWTDLYCPSLIHHFWSRLGMPVFKVVHTFTVRRNLASFSKRALKWASSHAIVNSSKLTHNQINHERWYPDWDTTFFAFPVCLLCIFPLYSYSKHPAAQQTTLTVRTEQTDHSLPNTLSRHRRHHGLR